MAYSFWERYLRVFDEVIVVARARKTERIPECCKRVDGRGVRFHALPDYNGPVQYLQHYSALCEAVRAATPTHGAVILRVPSILATKDG